tara:strand:+ start:3107 stop:3232 length:126 start_codon:yes stop_codon:yes gene_type:complete
MLEDFVYKAKNKSAHGSAHDNEADYAAPLVHEFRIRIRLPF